MNTPDELFAVARQLEALSEDKKAGQIKKWLAALRTAAEEVGKSFSGSWLGYHSRVYYNDFQQPPAGANFSQEWGMQTFAYSDLGTVGDWAEYQFDGVVQLIHEEAGQPDLDVIKAYQEKLERAFNPLNAEIVSIIETETSAGSDNFILKLKDELDGVKPLSKSQIIRAWSPKGSYMTRDMVAMGQGVMAPPHIDVLAMVASVEHTLQIGPRAAAVAKKAASHLERKGRRRKATDRVGTNVFIGHGRSNLWFVLKDFIQDRAGLPCDEFNRVPIAGITNIARLSEMLDAAAMAFLVMTAEDEMADGAMQARMNVIHEAGLFQGRLGFTRAIILLEEGCTEFSNIQGLGQIRFPKGNIRAVFEDIREVLKREGLLD